MWIFGGVNTCKLDFSAWAVAIHVASPRLGRFGGFPLKRAKPRRTKGPWKESAKLLPDRKACGVAGCWGWYYTTWLILNVWVVVNLLLKEVTIGISIVKTSMGLLIQAVVYIDVLFYLFMWPMHRKFSWNHSKAKVWDDPPPTNRIILFQSGIPILHPTTTGRGFSSHSTANYSYLQFSRVFPIVQYLTKRLVFRMIHESRIPYHQGAKLCIMGFRLWCKLGALLETVNWSDISI